MEFLRVFDRILQTLACVVFGVGAALSLAYWNWQWLAGAFIIAFMIGIATGFVWPAADEKLWQTLMLLDKGVNRNSD